MSSVRTRFAPSPTGLIHIGGVRTALFAWLVARQNGGKFVLRIEDTDQAREVQGSVEHIIESLSWLGIKSDEPPIKQSDRLEVYKHWALELVKAGLAYADTSTPAELDKLRAEAKANKKPFLFRDHRPKNPPPWDGTQPLRLKSNPKTYKWHDAVMGDLSAGPEAIDDFILMKSDGFPTYNFAHIIDDHEMKITHVIRSQEFLASVPKYLNTYEALAIKPPVLATLPYVLSEAGNKKLSKRDGAKDILAYRDEGYLPEAMINFLATLGWNDGTEQEIFSVSELIKKFDLGRVQKSGARFDEERLKWMNGTWIRSLDAEELYKRIDKKFWPATIPKELDNDEYKIKVLSLVQERLKYFSELSTLTEFFFIDLPLDPDLIKSHKLLGKLEREELKALLRQSYDALEASDFSVGDLTKRLNKLLGATKTKPALLFSLVRIATTQAPASPALASTMALLGKERSLARIRKMLE